MKGYIKINNEEGEKPSVEVQLINNTLWLTKWEMAELFGVFTNTIGNNLRSIFKSGLLSEKDVTYNYSYTTKNGQKAHTVFYNLEAIVFVSYRISSANARLFRQWLNDTLRKHLKNRDLKQSGQFIYFIPLDSHIFIIAKYLFIKTLQLNRDHFKYSKTITI